MIYWFSVDPDRPEILDVGIRNGLWGVADDDRDEIDPLEPGDHILFFHRDDGFVLCEVTSEPYTEKVPVWSEVDYPHRVRISDPVETDRYAHLGEVHDCLRDPETGEVFPSAAEATATLERATGTFRPLSDEEFGCLVRRLGWTLPAGVAPAAPEGGRRDEDGDGGEGDGSDADGDVAGEQEPGQAPAVAEAEPTDAPEADDPAEARQEAGEEAPEAEPAATGSTADVDEAPEAEPDTEAEPVAEARPPEAEPAAEDEPPADAGPPAEPGPEEPERADAAEPSRAREAGAPRVILAPAAGNDASRRRWEETVESGVPVERLSGRLPEEEIERLRRGQSADRVRVWGTAPARDERSRAQWADSGPGDVILFTGGGEVFASARILATRRDPELAEELWGRRDDGDTWEFLFFATEPVPQAVSYEEFNDVAGYESGYRIPRLNVLGTERSLRVLGAFPEFGLASPREPGGDDAGDREAGSAGDGPEPPAAAADVADADTDAGEEGAAARAPRLGAGEPEAGSAREIDPTAEAAEDAGGAPWTGGVGVMDDARLRTLLFGRRELGRCALCGRLLPVDLLSVVYVKPLEACTSDELEDVGNNVLPGCRLGCAGLFREGYLVVEEGRVRSGRDEPLTDPAAERVEELTGARCEYWHSGSEPYFRWHAAEHRAT